MVGEIDFGTVVSRHHFGAEEYAGGEVAGRAVGDIADWFLTAWEDGDCADAVYGIGNYTSSHDPTPLR